MKLAAIASECIVSESIRDTVINFLTGTTPEFRKYRKELEGLIKQFDTAAVSHFSNNTKNPGAVSRLIIAGMMSDKTLLNNTDWWDKMGSYLHIDAGTMSGIYNKISTEVATKISKAKQVGMQLTENQSTRKPKEYKPRFDYQKNRQNQNRNEFGRDQFSQPFMKPLRFIKKLTELGQAITQINKNKQQSEVAPDGSVQNSFAIHSLNPYIIMRLMQEYQRALRASGVVVPPPVTHSVGAQPAEKSADQVAETHNYSDYTS